MTLEPGYDPIEHRDDGFSITVFFADLALAEWYVKNHNSERWWDVMPKAEVFLDKVDFVMIDPDSSERFWPHLANSEAPDLHLQANTFTARSWYSIDNKSKESEETTKSLNSQTTPPNNTFLPISSEVRHRESTKDSNPVKICQIREGLIQQRNQMRATFIKMSRIIYHAHESWNQQLEKIRNPENERHDRAMSPSGDPSMELKVSLTDIRALQSGLDNKLMFQSTFDLLDMAKSAIKSQVMAFKRRE